MSIGRTLRDLREAFETNFRMCAVGGCLAHPTPISRELYDRASAEGFDMKGYAVESGDDPQMEC